MVGSVNLLMIGNVENDFIKLRISLIDIVTTTLNFFINNWKSTTRCAFEQRVGSKGDGGKWVCDVQRLERDDYTPVIYSFGSSGEFSFEIEIKKILPKAEIHTFDKGRYLCPIGVCTFHEAMIGDGIQNGTKSLNMVIDELGHRQRQIDILKIDIEGSEYPTFEQFFKHPKNTTGNTVKEQDEREIPYIRQILIEIHMPDGVNDTRTRPVHDLFELFRFNNYAIFHKEVNPNAPNDAYEYALIRLNPQFFISS